VVDTIQVTPQGVGVAEFVHELVGIRQVQDGLEVKVQSYPVRNGLWQAGQEVAAPSYNALNLCKAGRSKHSLYFFLHNIKGFVIGNV